MFGTPSFGVNLLLIARRRWTFEKSLTRQFHQCNLLICSTLKTEPVSYFQPHCGVLVIRNCLMLLHWINLATVNLYGAGENVSLPPLVGPNQSLSENKM
jgi:hypothetical protein